MSRQRTSTTTVEPVSPGLARALGRMTEDALLTFPGGNAEADFAKGHPDFQRMIRKCVEGLAHHRKAMLEIKGRPSFMKLALGTYETMTDIRAVYSTHHIEICHDANVMMDRVILSREHREIELVQVFAHELCIGERVDRNELVKRSRQVGLKLCPSEVGPLLPLSCLGPTGSVNWEVMMEPLKGGTMDHCIFVVRLHEYRQSSLSAREAKSSVFVRGNPMIFTR